MALAWAMIFMRAFCNTCSDFHKERLLLNYVSVFRKEFKEKKVSGKIAIALISLFHVQIK